MEHAREQLTRVPNTEGLSLELANLRADYDAILQERNALAHQHAGRGIYEPLNVIL